MWSSLFIKNSIYARIWKILWDFQETSSLWYYLLESAGRNWYRLQGYQLQCSTSMFVKIFVMKVFVFWRNRSTSTVTFRENPKILKLSSRFLYHHHFYEPIKKIHGGVRHYSPLNPRHENPYKTPELNLPRRWRYVLVIILVIFLLLMSLRRNAVDKSRKRGRKADVKKPMLIRGEPTLSSDVVPDIGSWYLAAREEKYGAHLVANANALSRLTVPRGIVVSSPNGIPHGEERRFTIGRRFPPRRSGMGTSFGASRQGSLLQLIAIDAPTRQYIRPSYFSFFFLFVWFLFDNRRISRSLRFSFPFSNFNNSCKMKKLFDWTFYFSC